MLFGHAIDLDLSNLTKIEKMSRRGDDDGSGGGGGDSSVPKMKNNWIAKVKIS